MATPLVFKMGTGAITNPTPGTYYISKTEKDGTYKWNIQIADDNGALYDILTPDNVKGLEYTDDDNKIVTITAEDFKQLEQNLLDLENKFNDQTTDFNNNLMPLSGGTFIGDVTFGEADDLDVVSNATFNNNVTFNQVPVIIKSIGEGDATAYEVVTLVEVENIVNNSADEINKTITDFKAEYNDYTNDNNTKVNNKINKANDTFTGQTDFGTNTQGITTNFYGTQNFNGTTNFTEAPKIDTETVTTVEYVDPKFITVNTTLDEHAGSIGDIQNLLGEVQQSVPYLDSPNTFTKLNTFDGSTTFDGTVEFNNQVEFKNTVITDTAVTLKGTTKVTGTIEVPTPTADAQAATKNYVDDLRNTATDASNQLQTNKAGRAEENTFSKTNTFADDVSFSNVDKTVTINSALISTGTSAFNTSTFTNLPTITGSNLDATEDEELVTNHHVNQIKTGLETKINDINNALTISISDVKGDVDTFLKDADLTTNAVDTLKEIQAELDAGEANAASMLGEITKLKDGTTPAGKATADANGNNIVNTYETKTAADDTYIRIDTRIKKFESTIEFDDASYPYFTIWPSMNGTTAQNTSDRAFVIKSYVDDAKTSAISTAAADATTKADAAESNSNNYTDGKIATVNNTITSNYNTLNTKFNSYLPLAGGTITGDVTFSSSADLTLQGTLTLNPTTPVGNYEAVHVKYVKDYVDNAINTLQNDLATELGTLL